MKGVMYEIRDSRDGKQRRERAIEGEGMEMRRRIGREPRITLERNPSAKPLDEVIA